LTGSSTSYLNNDPQPPSVEPYLDLLGRDFEHRPVAADGQARGDEVGGVVGETGLMSKYSLIVWPS